MDKPNNDFGAKNWPFPWDPYLELGDGAPTTTQPAATTRRSSQPPAPPSEVDASPAAAQGAQGAADWDVSPATAPDGEPIWTARTLPSVPTVAPFSLTMRKRLHTPWETGYDSSPPTHLVVEPPAGEPRSHTIAWVIGLAAALGLLAWLTLRLPSFAMNPENVEANAKLMNRQAMVLDRGATRPAPADAVCSQLASAETAGPAAAVSDARQAGATTDEAVAAQSQGAKATAAKETKAAPTKTSKRKPSSPSKPRAPLPAMASNTEPVYPDPTPAPGPISAPAPAAPPTAEGEIFNRSSSPN